MEVPSTKPYFSEDDIETISSEIRSILKSGRLILGSYTTKFEEAFREYCGVKHAVALSSCTAALEIVMRYYDITNQEVIVPTNTFIATGNSVIYNGGTLVLADIKPETLCLDPSDMLKRITPKTRGVIVVHIAGLPCPETEEILAICRERGLFLVEDVAHAHGATINGQKTGSFGDAGCFSFYPTKVMTTGVGGMLTTNNDALAEYAISLRHYGVGNGLHHIVNLGYDWLMPEINSVLGIQQLRNLEANVTRRNKIASKYASALSKSEGLELYEVPPRIRHSYYKYPVRLSPDFDKRLFIDKMQSDFGVGIGSIYDPPCHLQPLYQRLFGFKPGAFPIADTILGRTCCLPIYQQMTDEEVDYVLNSLKVTLPDCRTGLKIGGKCQ